MNEQLKQLMRDAWHIADDVATEEGRDQQEVFDEYLEAIKNENEPEEGEDHVHGGVD